MGIAQVLIAVPKRYPLKWNKCNYQLLFNKGAHTNKHHLREQQKSSLKQTQAYFFISLSAP